MTLDLTQYRRAQKPAIKAHLDRHGLKDLERKCSELAVSLPCPVIAVCFFVGELYGFSETILGMIERLSLFYRIEEIIGKLEN